MVFLSLLTVAVILSMCVGLIVAWPSIFRHALGTQDFEYPLADAKDLSESLALEYANRSLDASGFSPQRFVPVLDDRAIKPDQFCTRNAFDRNRVSIMFESDADQRAVYVVVWIDGDTLRCTIVPAR